MNDVLLTYPLCLLHEQNSGKKIYKKNQRKEEGIKVLGGRRWGEKKDTQIKHTIKNAKNLCEKSKLGKIMEAHANLLYLREITKEEERTS